MFEFYFTTNQSVIKTEKEAEKSDKYDKNNNDGFEFKIFWIFLDLILY